MDENPFASPLSDVSSFPRPMPGDAWYLGDRLVIPRDAVLPDRCVKCNATAGPRVNRTYYWHSPVLYWVLLAGAIPYFLVAVILQKTAKVDFGMCRTCFGKRRQRLAVGAAGMLGGAALFVAGFAYSRHDVALYAIPVGLVVFFVGVYLFNDALVVFSPKKIDDQHAYLANAGLPFLYSLPPLP